MSITLLKGDERLPLYQRLADLLRNEIKSGARKPGDRLPSENIIAEDYGLAPGTARKALAELVNDGILERVQGRGTFVRRPSFDQSLFRFFRFRSKGSGQEVPKSRIRSRSVKPFPDHVADKLAQPRKSDGIQMSRLRIIDGAPVVLEEIWLPLEPFRAFLEIKTDDLGDLLYPVYDACCEQVVARAEEILTAEAAGKDAARLLNIAVGEPIMVVDRLARGFDGCPLEWRRSRGPAKLFHYQIEIR